MPANIDSGPVTRQGDETPADLLSTLPVEIISQIFYHACKPNLKWQRDCSPLLLGQLSRQYRHYAWTTSELWATVVIRVNLSKNLAVQTELLEEWLARTMGRPIDIYFEVETSVPMQWRLFLRPNNNNRPCIVPMIHLLTRYSPHWRCIDFLLPPLLYPIFTTPSEADNDQVTQPVSTNRPLDLPLLVSASFRRDESDISPDDRVNLDLTLAPSLRTLSLSFFRMSTTTFKSINPKQITHLVCDHVSALDVHDLLPRLPNLQEVTFHHALFLPTIPGRRDQRTRHQNLRKLELVASHDIDLSFILLEVIFPRLESLSIRVSSTMSYTRLFKRFTDRDSNSHLTSLSLSCKLAREFDFIIVLSTFDSLRELHIQDSSTQATPEWGLSHTFFDALHPEADFPYLPSLEVFSYQGNLVVQAIDFLEPLLIRSRIREGSSGTDGNLEGMAIMRKIKIQADQVSNSAVFSIVAYPDTQYVWEVMMMMEQGILELITLDGELWE